MSPQISPINTDSICAHLRNLRRIALCVLCASVIQFSSGCVAIVAAKQRAALPPGHIGAGKVVVNIPAVGGGTLEVKEATKGADGSLKVGEYHSEIQTAYGMVKVDLIDAELGQK